MLWYGTEIDSTVLPIWNSLAASPPVVVPKPTACWGLKYTISSKSDSKYGVLIGKVNVSLILVSIEDAVCAIPGFVPLTILKTLFFLKTLSTETISWLVVPIPTEEPTEMLLGIDDRYTSVTIPTVVLCAIGATK